MKRFLWILAPVLLLAVAAALLLRPAAVLTWEGGSLSSTEFSYYYWSEFFYFREAYGEYLSDSVDFSKPLQDQTTDDGRSWQDALTEEALSVAADTLSVAFAAEDAGFSLPTEYEDALEETWNGFLQQSNGDLDAYLQDSYGKGADRDSFYRYLYRSHLAAAYTDHLYESLSPADEEIAAYYEAHAGEYLDNYGLTKDDPWQEQAKQDLTEELFRDQLAAIRAAASFTVHRNAVNIVPPKGLYEE